MHFRECIYLWGIFQDQKSVGGQGYCVDEIN